MSGLLAGIGSIIGGIGGLFGSSNSRKGQREDARNQMELNKNQIQWRVADAKAAGIHPLYALGPTGMSYSPVSQHPGDYGGSSFAQAGQDISRAIAANRGERERREMARQGAIHAAIDRERQNTLFGQQVERNALENDLLRSQISRLQMSAQLGPPSPVINGTNERAIPRPSEPIMGARGAPAREAGTITDFQYRRHDDGGIGVTYSEEAKDRSEDDIVEQLGWHWRNRFNPSTFMGGPTAPSASEFPLPEGVEWRWDAWRQAFYPRDVATGRWIRRN